MTGKLKILFLSFIVLFFAFVFLGFTSKVYAQDCSCYCQLCAETQPGCPNLRCDGTWEQDLGWVNCDAACLAVNPTQPQLCCTWGPNGNYSCHCNSTGGGGGTTKEYNPPVCSGTEKVSSSSIRVSWVSKDPWADCFEVQWYNSTAWVSPQGCGGCISNPGENRIASCLHSPVSTTSNQQYRIKAYNSGGGDSNWTSCNYTAPIPTPTLRPTSPPVPTSTPTPVIVSCNTATVSPSGNVVNGSNVTYNPISWTAGWDTLTVYRYNAIGPPATACGTYNTRPCIVVADLNLGSTLNFWTNISRVINGVRYSCMYNNTWHPSAPNSNPQTSCTNNCSVLVRVVTPTPAPCIDCLGDCGPLSSPCCEGYYCESATGKCIRSCPAEQVFDPRYETCSCVALPTSPPSVTPPACPACVSVLLADVQRADGRYNKSIRWADASGETGYRIYRCTGAGCNPANSLLTILASGITSYIDTNNNTGFGPGTWVYEVRPFKSGCNTLDCPNYTNVIFAITPTRIPTRTPTALPTPICAVSDPSQPVLVSPADGETLQGTSVIMRWLAVQWGNGCPNNNRYKVYLTPNINFASDGNLTNDGLTPVCDLNENIVYCLQTNLH